MGFHGVSRHSIRIVRILILLVLGILIGFLSHLAFSKYRYQGYFEIEPNNCRPEAERSLVRAAVTRDPPVKEMSLNIDEIDDDSKPARFRAVDADLLEVLNKPQQQPNATPDSSVKKALRMARFDGQEFAPIIPSHTGLELLESDVVFNIVHYVWCEKKIFEFQHYLSVRSVVRYINPERIVFHYLHYPRYDIHHYNTWFEELKMEFPFVELHELKEDKDACSSPAEMMTFMRRKLQNQGGIYVHFNTIFTSFPLIYRRHDVSDATNKLIEGFLVVRRGKLRSNLESPTDRTMFSKCPVAADYLPSKNICAIKRGPYYPRDAWDRDDAFSRQVNLIMYDSERRPRATPVPEAISVPNIGHVLWLGGGKMDFVFYLNCLSHLHILKVDTYYIHGDTPPTGKYWDLVKTEPKVKFVKRTWPDLVFRNKVKVWNHMSDIFRADVMVRYGGYYTDTDAVWINPVPKELLRYEAVASYDWPKMYEFFPDYVNFGVSFGQRGGRFWQLQLESMKTFKDDMYGYNGLLRPYKIFERHPGLVHLYDKLQVMCWELRCHPTWYPDFRDKLADHQRYKDFDWRLAHSFHWTEPSPKELKDQQTLMNSTGIFAEIGKHILRAAGKIDDKT